MCWPRTIIPLHDYSKTKISTKEEERQSSADGMGMFMRVIVVAILIKNVSQQCTIQTQIRVHGV